MDNKNKVKVGEIPKVPRTIKPPPEIELRQSDIDPEDIGAWCAESIPENHTFGPFKGHINQRAKLTNFKRAWEIFDKDTNVRLHVLNATNQVHSDWMRYVNCTLDPALQNLASIQRKTEVFYMAIRDIKSGEELVTLSSHICEFWQEAEGTERRKIRVVDMANTAPIDPSNNEVILRVPKASRQNVIKPPKVKWKTPPEMWKSAKKSKVVGNKSMRDENIKVAGLDKRVIIKKKETCLDEETTGTSGDSPDIDLKNLPITLSEDTKVKSCEQISTNNPFTKILILNVMKSAKDKHKAPVVMKKLPQKLNTPQSTKSDVPDMTVEKYVQLIKSDVAKKKAEKETVKAESKKERKIVENRRENGKRPSKMIIPEDFVETDKIKMERRGGPTKKEVIAKIKRSLSYPSRNAQHPPLGNTTRTNVAIRAQGCDDSKSESMVFETENDVSGADVTGAQSQETPHAEQTTAPHFTFAVSQRHHVQDKSGRRLYKCEVCSSLYGKGFSLKRHFVHNHIYYKYVSLADVTNCNVNIVYQMEHYAAPEDIRDAGLEEDAEWPHVVKEQNRFDRVWLPGLYRCDECHTLFDYIDDLVSHDHQHPPQSQKKRTFTCDHCPMKFLFHRNLTRHRAIHISGDRPYICGICNQAFPTIFSLKKHKKIHSGRFSCSYCSLTFSQSFIVKKHMRIMHAKHVSNCSSCGEEFFGHVALRYHLYSVHNVGSKAEYERVTENLGNTGNLGDEVEDIYTGLAGYKRVDGDNQLPERTDWQSYFGQTIDPATGQEHPQGAMDSCFMFVCTVCKTRFRSYSGMCKHRRNKHQLYVHTVAKTPPITVKMKKVRNPYLVPEPASDSDETWDDSDVGPIVWDPYFYDKVSSNIAYNFRYHIHGKTYDIWKYEQERKREIGESDSSPEKMSPVRRTEKKYQAVKLEVVNNGHVSDDVMELLDEVIQGIPRVKTERTVNDLLDEIVDAVSHEDEMENIVREVIYDMISDIPAVRSENIAIEILDDLIGDILFEDEREAVVRDLMNELVREVQTVQHLEVIITPIIDDMIGTIPCEKDRSCVLGDCPTPEELADIVVSEIEDVEMKAECSIQTVMDERAVISHAELTGNISETQSLTTSAIIETSVDNVGDPENNVDVEMKESHVTDRLPIRKNIEDISSSVDTSYVDGYLDVTDKINDDGMRDNLHIHSFNPSLNPIHHAHYETSNTVESVENQVFCIIDEIIHRIDAGSSSEFISAYNERNGENYTLKDSTNSSTKHHEDEIASVERVGECSFVGRVKNLGPSEMGKEENEEKDVNEGNNGNVQKEGNDDIDGKEVDGKNEEIDEKMEEADKKMEEVVDMENSGEQTRSSSQNSSNCENDVGRGDSHGQTADLVDTGMKCVSHGENMEVKSENGTDEVESSSKNQDEMDTQILCQCKDVLNELISKLVGTETEHTSRVKLEEIEEKYADITSPTKCKYRMYRQVKLNKGNEEFFNMDFEKLKKFYEPADCLMKATDVRKCGVCKKTFTSDSEYEVHFQDTHACGDVLSKVGLVSLSKEDDSKVDDSNKRFLQGFESCRFGAKGAIQYACCACFRLFNRRRKLTLHQKKRHPYILCTHLQVEDGHRIDKLHFKVPSAIGSLTSPARATKCVALRSELVFMCSVCDRRFSKIAHLHSHILECFSLFGSPEPPQTVKRPTSSAQSTPVKAAIMSVESSPVVKAVEEVVRFMSTCNRAKRKIVDYEELAGKKQKKTRELKYIPENHIRRRDTSDCIDLHQCGGCGLKFQSLLMLEKHAKNCEKKDKLSAIKAVQQRTDRLVCHYCGKEFSYAKTVLNHYTKGYCNIRKYREANNLLTISDREREEKVKQLVDDVMKENHEKGTVVPIKLSGSVVLDNLMRKIQEEGIAEQKNNARIDAEKEQLQKASKVSSTHVVKGGKRRADGNADTPKIKHSKSRRHPNERMVQNVFISYKNKVKASAKMQLKKSVSLSQMSGHNSLNKQRIYLRSRSTKEENMMTPLRSSPRKRRTPMKFSDEIYITDKDRKACKADIMEKSASVENAGGKKAKSPKTKSGLKKDVESPVEEKTMKIVKKKIVTKVIVKKDKLTKSKSVEYLPAVKTVISVMEKCQKKGNKICSKSKDINSPVSIKKKSPLLKHSLVQVTQVKREVKPLVTEELFVSTSLSDKPPKLSKKLNRRQNSGQLLNTPPKLSPVTTDESLGKVLINDLSGPDNVEGGGFDNRDTAERLKNKSAGEIVNDATPPAAIKEVSDLDILLSCCDENIIDDDSCDAGTKDSDTVDNMLLELVQNSSQENVGSIHGAYDDLSLLDTVYELSPIFNETDTSVTDDPSPRGSAVSTVNMGKTVASKAYSPRRKSGKCKMVRTVEDSSSITMTEISDYVACKLDDGGEHTTDLYSNDGHTIISAQI